jgi:thioredoxin reductase
LLDAGSYRGKRILVVGGGDSAVEAAMGLARQPGNRVTLSYRKPEFTRLKERNVVRLKELVARDELAVILSSEPEEIRPGSVRLRIGDEIRELPTDFVWIFAGGTPPKPFLESIGIAFGRKNLADAVHSEAIARQLPKSINAPVPASRS